MNAHPFSIKPNDSLLKSSVLSIDLIGNTTGEPDLTFVINLVDGEGREFYLDINNNLVSLSICQLAEPQSITTDELVLKLAYVRNQNAGSCQVYGLPLPEFRQLCRTNKNPDG